MDKYKNILLIKNRAIGDSIMTLSSAQYLKEIFPEAHLTLALPTWITPLYKEVNCAVDEVLPISLKSLKGYIQLYKNLRQRKFDLIYEFHQSGSTAKFFSLYSKIFKIPYLYHNHHLKSETGVLDQGKIKPLIQRDLDGIWGQLKLKSPPPEYLNYEPMIQVKTAQKTNSVVFGVVASRHTKMWPLKYYSELAKLIYKISPEIHFIIPISGSQVDQEIKSELESLLSVPHTFIQKPLQELPLELVGAKAYIGNDTGLKHLCVALNIPTFTFFGPEPPLEWHPYCTNRHPIFYIEKLKCRTRQYHYCPLDFCDLTEEEHMQCLKDISPEVVFKRLKELWNQ